MQYRLTTLADSACAVGQETAVDAADVLAYPTADDLLGPTLALLPVGPAWGTPDGAAPPRDSVRARLWRGLLGPISEAFSAAFAVALQAKATTVSIGIDGWEAELGLPDPCAAGAAEPITVPDDAWFPLTDESGAPILAGSGDPILVDDVPLWVRREAVKRKVLATAVLRPADFVCLAWSMGYEAEVVEVDAFRCGVSECGVDELTTDRAVWDWYIRIRPRDTSIYFHCGSSELGVDALVDPMIGAECFECGVSECGVDGLLDLAPPWSDVEHFVCGEGQCGVTPLSSYPFARDVQCFARRLAPVETNLHFRFPLIH